MEIPPLLKHGQVKESNNNKLPMMPIITLQCFNYYVFSASENFSRIYLSINSQNMKKNVEKYCRVHLWILLVRSIEDERTLIRMKI